MKLTIPTKLLVAALASLKSVSKPSSVSPILGNVRISANKKTVTLLGSDNEKQLSITLDAKIKETGETTINCGRLYKVLSEMNADECSITTDDKHASVIKCGSAVLNIRGLDPAEMPTELTVESGTAITMPVERFNSILTKSLSHASQDAARAILQTVLFTSRGKKLSIEAADGKHGIVCDTGLDFTASGQFIVPKESVPTMIGLASSGEAEIVIGEGVMSVATEMCKFVTKLIEGSMPDIAKAFPPKSERKLSIEVNREELLALTKRALAFVGDGIPCANVKCDGRKLTMQASDHPSVAGGAEGNQSGEDHILLKGNGAEIEWALNPICLQDCLKALGGENVTIELVDAISPLVMCEDGITTTVVPMRVK